LVTKNLHNIFFKNKQEAVVIEDDEAVEVK